MTEHRTSEDKIYLQKNVLDTRRWATREALRIDIVTWIEPVTCPCSGPALCSHVP